MALLKTRWMKGYVFALSKDYLYSLQDAMKAMVFPLGKDTIGITVNKKGKIVEADFK